MKRNFWIGISAGVLVVLGAGAFIAAKAQLFSSGKQVLLHAIQTQDYSGVTSADESVTLKLENLHTSDQATQAILDQLNHASLMLNLVIDKVNHNQEKLEGDIFLHALSKQYSGHMWADSNKIVFDVRDFEPLVQQYFNQTGSLITLPQLPKYLVLGEPKTKSMWESFNQTSIAGPSHMEATKNLETLLVEGIPDKYITRPHLNEVEIQFSQSDLKDILDAETDEIYKHQDEIIHDVNTIQPNGTPVTKEQYFSIPEAQYIKQLNDGLKTMGFDLSSTKIDFKQSSGALLSTMDTGMSINDATSGSSGSMELSITASVPSGKTVNVPAPDSSNSESIDQFFNQ